jgi:hypothetical protein
MLVDVCSYVSLLSLSVRNDKFIASAVNNIKMKAMRSPKMRVKLAPIIVIPDIMCDNRSLKYRYTAFLDVCCSCC